MYIFPGLGLGAVVARATKVTDSMIITAAKTLAALTTEEELQNGQVYPNLEKIREISFEIAVEVAKCAEKEGLNRVSAQDWRKAVKEYIYEPTYAPILEEKITSNI
jgi:malate dehydrogenase (oxaloacetate-decarboxylating)(NADP+)